MAMTVALAVFLLAAGAGTSEGAVHKVGDASGWTILGSPNYGAWASKQSFRVGDTVVFEYNTSFHNVLEVSKADYDACNAASPIATHTSGNDSITINSKGHRYFICGFPGHCLAGQKVDIDVSKSSSAAPSTSPVASPPSSSPVASPPAVSPSAIPPTAPTPLAPASSGAGSSISSSGGVSPSASAPKPNGGTRAVSEGIALAVAVLSFVALSPI